jgi:hypothetical protein
LEVEGRKGEIKKRGNEGEDLGSKTAILKTLRQRPLWLWTESRDLS